MNIELELSMNVEKRTRTVMNMKPSHIANRRETVYTIRRVYGPLGGAAHIYIYIYIYIYTHMY